MSNVVTRIKPLYYIHVLDNNTNLTRVEIGPQTFTRLEHEVVVAGPSKMVMVPPRHYCIVANPVQRDADGQVEKDQYGNYRLAHGDEEMRFEQEPFALYPGESLAGSVTALQVVPSDAALRLRCVRDFDGHVAGDEWLFRGPDTYHPRKEVSVVEVVRATIIKENQALKLRARRSCKDSSGVDRQAGEEWLVRESGAYLPNVDEEIVQVVNAIVLTEKRGLQLRAQRTFTDVSGKVRKAGVEWLVTLADSEVHIPDVYETVVGEVQLVTLNSRQYCVVLEPVDANGVPRFGQRELRQGEASFFLQPGERLENGIQNVYVLGEEEALLLQANEEYKDGETVRQPGDRWMIYGPTDFVPSVEMTVIEKRRAMPLDENEGVYVRDIRTGHVRAVMGETYMLKPNEALWEKDLSPQVEQLLQRRARDGAIDKKSGSSTATRRVKHQVVTYRAPHGSAVQVYDYRAKKSRVVFGPELVMLGPDEHFTVLSLSGGTPKRSGAISAIALFLGPDFMTDVVTVETSDHARLSLNLAYNWNFEVDPDDLASGTRVFNVPDFVGDACKAIASRVRGAVSAVPFDDFHKESATVIRRAVFGVDKATGEIRSELRFKSNGLVVTNVDTKSVEPVDQRTRDSLQKSVQLAIEITTSSQEAAARHEAERMEQEARGRLERQKIVDEVEAEKARKSLLQLQAESAAVESTGAATAEARALAEASFIEGEASVKQARLEADATQIRTNAELSQLRGQQDLEVAHQRALIELEIAKAKELADIEANRFAEVVDALGKDTLVEMASSGPKHQAALLKGLGLKSFLITDGKQPVNLFNTAKGLIAGADNMGH